MTDTQATEIRDDARSTIIDAAANLLRERGAGAVTTRGVAKAAGVQAPTIYRLFGDKGGLIDAVAEHVMATYVAAKSAAASTTEDDPVADLRAGWQIHVDFGLANPELYTLLNTPGRSESSPAAAAGIDVLRTRVRRLATAGLLRVEEQRAVSMIHAAGSGTVLALLEMPPAERDPGLSEAIFSATLSGILASTPATTNSGTSTVAVTFASILPELPALTDAERALMSEWLTRSIAHLQDH